MKSIPVLIAFLILPFLMSNEGEHEYYVSVTEVEYVQKEQSLQIITQIYTDDFETLIRKRYDDSLTLTSEDESELVAVYMERYLTDKLRLKVNGAEIKFNFLGKEYKEGITYCYLEIENVPAIQSIEVTNQVLFDVFEDQENIVRLKLLNRNKSFLLVPEKDTCMLNFK